MVQQWRLIDTGYKDGFTNMAIDEAILQSVIAGLTPPTVRLYGWSPPTFSLGYFQSAGKEVNLETCSQLGVDLVRRPTGGRGVLHEHELTYSVIFSESDPNFPSSLIGAYKLIGEALKSGLSKLNLEVSLVPEISSKRESRPRIRSGACFSSPSSYELLSHGKKIVGSAQKRIKGGVLQHGSILLDVDRQKLFALLNFNSEEDRQEMLDHSYKKMASLAEIGGKTFLYEEVAEAVSSGFAEILGGPLNNSRLSPEESKNAELLRRNKYSTDSWNFLR